MWARLKTPRLEALFRGSESSNRTKQRQQEYQNQPCPSQQPAAGSIIERDSQTITGQDHQVVVDQINARDMSETEAYTGPCHLLNLPFEIRELILQWIYGSITVYLRSKPPDPSSNKRYTAWTNAVEWNNPCPDLLRVNRQLHDEALRTTLQNCVLDIWGTSRLEESFLRYLPTAAGQIRHLAITFERCK